MCGSDVYRVRKTPEAPPKKRGKLRDLIHEDSGVEEVCASARLIEAVEVLSK